MMSQDPQLCILLRIPTVLLAPCLPGSFQAGRLEVGVEGMGRGKVVCVSPKPGSCADESRLNGEPQAVLSRPALSHLLPKSPHAFT